MPRIGCGLAGGRWDLVEPLVTGELTDHGIPVTVYDVPGGPVWTDEPVAGPGRRGGQLT
ncbi:hypothetical protein ACFV4N_07340 [Actinosynnema sp. NPDC059797]